MHINDAIGSIGVAMMLVVFLLNIVGKLENFHPFYIIMNFIGSGFACAASVMIEYEPFIILEGTWCLISGWAMFNYFFKKN